MDKRHKLLLCNLILCACLFVFALVTIVMASSALTSKRRLIAALILLLADRSAVAASGISMELNIPWVFYVFTAASFLSSALCLAAAFAKEKREV